MTRAPPSLPQPRRRSPGSRRRRAQRPHIKSGHARVRPGTRCGRLRRARTAGVLVVVLLPVRALGAPSNVESPPSSTASSTAPTGESYADLCAQAPAGCPPGAVPASLRGPPRIGRVAARWPNPSAGCGRSLQRRRDRVRSAPSASMRAGCRPSSTRLRRAA